MERDTKISDYVDDDDVSVPRRDRSADVEREIEPGPSEPSDEEAVYGESGLKPIDDERDVHHADIDDIV